MPKTHLQRSTTQSVANNTWTLASWGTTAVQDDVGAFSGSSPTLITVPAGKTKFRATIYTAWASNLVNTRWVTIEKNGGSTLEVDLRYGKTESMNHWRTRWHTVVPGDYLRIFLHQNTGGALNFGGAGASTAYIEVEWA